MGTGAKVFVVTWAALGIAAGGIALATDDDEREEPRNYTPTQAACRMLRTGDTPDEAYRAMRILLDDLEYSVGDVDVAARLAVERAVADGC